MKCFQCHLSTLFIVYEIISASLSKTTQEELTGSPILCAAIAPTAVPGSIPAR